MDSDRKADAAGAIIFLGPSPRYLLHGHCAPRSAARYEILKLG